MLARRHLDAQGIDLRRLLGRLDLDTGDLLAVQAGGHAHHVRPGLHSPRADLDQILAILRKRVLDGDLAGLGPSSRLRVSG
jgi:hypothetical protein